MSEPRAFVLGGNGSTIAFVNSFRPESNCIVTRLVPVAWTPIGVAVGDTWQNVSIAQSGLMDWVDRTFAPEDERSFVAPLRDIELLTRVQWHTELPEVLTLDGVLNIEDLPDEVADGLTNPPVSIVQCTACRRLCVRDDFIWKDKQLCAWDYHTQVFGKRGPWRNGPYEAHHFETLPACAYVVPPILLESKVEIVLATFALDDELVRQMIGTMLAYDMQRPYMAVRTAQGYTVLREIEA